jgi:DNA polymerase-3 subunit gamma/tau
VTILSRCLQFNLKHLTADQIAGQLRVILDKEGVPADQPSVQLIAGAANGSMRDALSLLDQAIAYGSGELREVQVREMLGSIDSADIRGLLEILLEGDADALIQRVNSMAEHNPDYDAVLAELLSNLHDIAVAQSLSGAEDVIGEALCALAARMEPEDVQLYYQIGLNGRRDLGMAPDPRAGFEMTLIRMLAFRPAPAPEGAPRGGGGRKPAAAPRKAAEADPAPVPQAAPAPGEDPSADGDWRRIIEAMGLSGLMKELAGHCVLKEHDENRLHLALSPAKEHLFNGAQKERLQDAVRNHFGGNVKLIISVEEPEAETPAQQRDREERERLEAAQEAMANDPNVRDIIDTFDATLDKDSVRIQS